VVRPSSPPKEANLAPFIQAPVTSTDVAVCRLTTQTQIYQNILVCPRASKYPHKYRRTRSSVRDISGHESLKVAITWSSEDRRHVRAKVVHNRNINKNEEANSVFEQVIDLCEASGIAFLGILHVPKRQTNSAMEKIAGGTAVAGSAKSAFMLIGRYPSAYPNISPERARRNFSRLLTKYPELAARLSLDVLSPYPPL
jgi:hypothetical protein